MEKTQISLLVFAVLGLFSSTAWLLYVKDPSNILIQNLNYVASGAWIVGDLLIALTIIAGAIHLGHRLEWF